MNVWSFTGNLGNDAESRFTQDGTCVVSFSVGVKSGYGDKATTTWARCSMFGKRADAISQYLTKGQLVGVTGEIGLREWKDKSNETRTSLEVKVADLTLLGKKDSGGHQQERNDRPAPPKKNDAKFDDLGDDIPF